MAEADLTQGRSQIVLEYDQKMKAELIRNHAFATSDFTGTAIVVKDARTKIDIDWLLPDNDRTPKRLCYSGGPAGAKKILSTMLANTDGNGDHFLEKGSSITSVGTSLRVIYATVGEGGVSQHDLTVTRCP